MERLAEDGRLSREMAECIETEDMMRFLRTKSGVRMLQAARNRKLYKEQPFVISVNASEIYQGDLSGEKILVQGIIDVYFEEEDGLVVLDYKTDQVKSRKELAKNIMRSLKDHAHARAYGKNCKREDYLFVYFKRGDHRMKILMYCLLALNVGVWLMYGIDKWKAKSGRWRIPEKVLLLAAFAGGSVGALAGMMMFKA